MDHLAEVTISGFDAWLSGMTNVDIQNVFLKENDTVVVWYKTVYTPATRVGSDRLGMTRGLDPVRS